MPSFFRRPEKIQKQRRFWFGDPNELFFLVFILGAGEQPKKKLKSWFRFFILKLNVFKLELKFQTTGFTFGEEVSRFGWLKLKCA